MSISTQTTTLGKADLVYVETALSFSTCLKDITYPHILDTKERAPHWSVHSFPEDLKKDEAVLRCLCWTGWDPEVRFSCSAGRKEHGLRTQATAFVAQLVLRAKGRIAVVTQEALTWTRKVGKRMALLLGPRYIYSGIVGGTAESDG